MGLKLFGSRSSYDEPVKKLNLGSRSSYDEPVKQPENYLPNPDPSNYRILRSERSGPFLLVEVNYPDCTNYEGRKILLFKGMTVEQLKRQGSIDPHFSESTKFASPIARFVPTQTGWEMGKCMMAMPLVIDDGPDDPDGPWAEGWEERNA